MVLGLIIPIPDYSQNLILDSTYSLGNLGERIQSLEATNSNDLLAVGYSKINAEFIPTIIKFDSSGNILWVKYENFDSLNFGYFDFIIKSKVQDQYFVAGYSYDTTWNNNFIARIDSGGNPIWVNRFNYATFYSTTIGGVVLHDNSLITTGEILTNTLNDIIVRRIDSIGNLIWEQIFNLNGTQYGMDLAEMMDGSVLLTGTNNNNLIVLRLNILNGQIFDSVSFPNRYTDIFFMDCNLLPNNYLGISGYARDGINLLGGYYLKLNQNLSEISYLWKGNGVTFGPVVLEDSSLIFSLFNSQDSIELEFTDSLGNVNNSIILGPINNGIFSSDYTQSNNIYLGGNTRTFDEDFWLAKIEQPKNLWIPDYCSYQPPIAGFEYEYNYPVLTLRDTSSGGLKYLDTVYTWQWNTSVGTSGIDDSLLVFFDTTVTNSIDIELVISNWYGCTDTVNRTLNFDPSGITVEKPLDFKIYPNPVKDILLIELSEPVENTVAFEIFDLHGNKVLRDEFTGTHLSSVVHGLSSGMYFFRIYSGSKMERGKIIKQ